MSIDASHATVLDAEADRFVGSLRDSLGDPWKTAHQKWIARAPGRLDVMGGFAESSGSLVLAYPLSCGVFAAAAPGRDGTVRLYAMHHEGNGSPVECVWRLADFCDTRGKPDVAKFLTMIADCECEGAREAGAAILGLCNQHDAMWPDGVTIGIRSSFGGALGIGAPAAVAVATVFAVGKALGVHVDAKEAINMAADGLQTIVCPANGYSAATVATCAPAAMLLQVRSDRREVAGAMALPAGYALSGIYCGMMNNCANEKFLEARTSTAMGTLLVGRIFDGEGSAAPPWNGFLSHLSVTDYVERVRDRLPTKMKGADFLDRFGEAGGPECKIDPAKTYKIRSRTEHHIYENARSHQFAERLARAARTHDAHAIAEAGELMYASHWSYGQRCGLGSIPTDGLVTLLRSRGADAGILGAKVSCRGSGGTVVVLHTDDDRGRESIQNEVQTFEQKFEHKARILNGSSPGADIWGVHQAG